MKIILSSLIGFSSWWGLHLNTCRNLKEIIFICFFFFISSKVEGSNGFPLSSQIFSSFSALTSGFARAISSLPTSLKSKVHPWFSGYLWDPQNVISHLHLNPVNPTRFLQTMHRFGCCCCGRCSATRATSTAGTGDSPMNSGRLNSGTWETDSTTTDEDENEGEEERDDLMEVAPCCSLRRKSL